MKKVGLILLTVVYLLLMKTFWLTVSADGSYMKSKSELNLGNYEKALSLANKSIGKNSREPRYYYGRAKIYLASTVVMDEEEKINAKEKALLDLQKAQNLNPNNLVTLRNVVPLYYFLGIDDLEKSSAENNADENFIEIVRKYYQDIKHYSPNDVGIYTLLAKYEKKSGLEEGLSESLENIERLRPDLLDWYLK